MAMTLRLTDELDAALTARSEREGKSKQQIVLEAVARDNERASLTIEDVVSEVMTEHADIVDALK